MITDEDDKEFRRKTTKPKQRAIRFHKSIDS